jgi:hypothetical protein
MPNEAFWLQNPLPIPMVYTSSFNAQRSYGKHEGVDLAATDSSGNPVSVLAAQSGLVVTGGRFAGDAFAWLLLANPADVFRILNVFSLDDVRTLYGLSTIVPASLGSQGVLGGVMLLWIVLPLLVARWRFR